ncbi:MAG: catalase [Desulfobulbaceae bacterium]|nr:catalase [Desulfobulbaceae bacterium]
MTISNSPKCPFEHITEQENEQIEEITDLTVKLLDQRYPSGKQILRGVHPKSHGCVKAIFKINEDVDNDLRVGLFAGPGQEFQAIVRFSNAAARVAPDINDGKHGSRGMAVKVLDVGGNVLLDDLGAHNQDFLMINQPMFAFANTEDYLQLNRILHEHDDDPKPLFIPALEKLKNSPQDLTEADKRILKSAQIVKGIQNTPESEDANPLEMRYFSASPFLFGENRAMKFSAKPVNKAKTTEFPEKPGDNYLRQALAATMNKDQDIVFSFMVQVRRCSDELEIENASSIWDESDFKFREVAQITIPAQQNDLFTPEQLESCEKLEYSPWHSLAEHQPIGSINRLRKSVYPASAEHRNRNDRNGKNPSGIRAAIARFIKFLFP